MKHIVIGLVVFNFIFVKMNAQNEANLIRNNPQHIEHFLLNTKEPITYSQSNVASLLNSKFGIESNWTHTNSYLDPYGIQHDRIQQYFDGYPVIGAQLIVHAKNEKILSITGRAASEIGVLQPSNTSPIQAIGLAKKYAGIPAKKDINIRSEEDQQPSLVVINENYPEHGGEYKLAWMVHIHEEKPHDIRKIFVDANSGALILNMDLMMSCGGEKGKMHTLFHGEQEIETEIENGQYITKDLSRGNGVQVRSVSGQFYNDDDNTWIEGSNDQINGAYDLFWGLQSTYDYFKNRFGRNGIDDQNILTNAILLDTGIYNNAFWDSNLKTLNFGLGNGISLKPFTSIDIVAHEYGHGVTQFTAGLEYLYESGALNEAFSDIFGKAVEYDYDQAQFNWLLGNKIYVDPAQAIRSMENPNKFSNPKYYRGKFWNSGSGDNGGVHSNSGVLNYWYYLLCTGGEGKNEGNKDFKVRAMGVDTATMVAYHLLRDYLTPTSNYADARNMSLQMLSQWWGLCSEQYNNVAEAWKAVGIGSNTLEGDLQLVTERTLFNICKDGIVELPSRIINHSCNQIILAGTKLSISYQMDNLAAVVEEIIVDHDVLPGDYFSFDFSSLPIVNRQGAVRLTIKLLDYFDSDTSNHSYTFFVTRNLNAASNDFNIQRMTVTGNSCPDLNAGYRASLVAVNNGCTVVPLGSQFVLEMKFDDSIAVYFFKNERSVYPGAQFRPPAFIIPRTFLGVKNVVARLMWNPDSDSTNNVSQFQIVYTDFTFKDEPETFTNQTYNTEKLQIRSEPFSYYNFIYQPKLNSDAFHVYGSSIFESGGGLRVNGNPEPDFFMNSNVNYITSTFLCANTQGMINPHIEFDLYQNLGDLYLSTYGFDDRFGSMCRLIYRNNRGQILKSDIIMLPETERNKVEKISRKLPDSTTLVEIQKLCLSLKLDFVGEIDLEKSDLIAIDNLVLTEGSTSTDDINEIGISLRPVPVGDIININLSERGSAINRLIIYDLNGKELQNIKIQSGQNVISIPASNLISGVYQLRCILLNGLSKNISFVKL
ncbi:MAG: M4 family metallopeptidase [Saprospiraceae bacterium]|nr:M4 family metallopeptidase [Saprospiraceae bacterium]